MWYYLEDEKGPGLAKRLRIINILRERKNNCGVIGDLSFQRECVCFDTMHCSHELTMLTTSTTLSGYIYVPAAHSLVYN